MTVVAIDRTPWDAADDFVKDSKGAIVANNLDNIRLALRRIDVSLAYDAFRREIVVDGASPTDTTFEDVWVRIIDRCGFRPSREDVRIIVTNEATKNTVHPVRDYLDRLVWDGTPRLDEWLVTYGGADDRSAYVRAVGALPLVAAVRRVRQPGAKFDEMLIGEGTQGQGKSTALRTLCPNDDWFSDDLPLAVDSKQVVERTSGKWIIEASELHGNRGREAEQLKAFLSRQTDGPVRLAYARLSVSVPRQFVIIGTTNTSVGYLKDATGGRRFWPVRVRRFDTEALLRDRDQLWAEAAAREAAGESIRLNAELWEAAGQQQEQRRATDPWEEVLEELIDGADLVRVDVDGDYVEADAISAGAVWGKLGVEANHRDNRHAHRVGEILQRHGFTKKQKIRTEATGKPQWHWLRVPSCSEGCSE